MLRAIIRSGGGWKIFRKKYKRGDSYWGPKSTAGISDVLTGASRSPIPQYFENWKKVDQKSAILKEKRL